MSDVYHPKPNSVEYPRIKVFIPYFSMQAVTAISLIGYDYLPIKTDGDYGYSEYFKKRWEESQTFISIEQDTVIYPGALEAIWDCPQEWCVYDVHLPNHRKRTLGNEVSAIPLACMKVAAEMINKTPNLWDEPIEWSKCDQQIIKSGIKVHQHFPGVVNANPALLGFAEIKGEDGGH